MSALQTIIATLVATIVSGTISLYLTHRKQRDLESYKAQLQAELEQSKLRIQNDLQIKFFEYQTKFSLLHQRQAEVVSDLYGMLGETNEYIIRLVSRTFDITDVNHAATTRAKYQSLAECYVKKQIYLEEEVCNKIDELLLKMRLAMTKSSIGQGPLDAGGHGLELWHEAWQSVSKEVPPILKELETQFRAFLSPKLSRDDKYKLGCTIRLGRTLMSAIPKRQQCGWCRHYAIAASTFFAAILIASGCSGPSPQTSAKNDSVGPPVTANGASVDSPESNPKFEVSLEDVPGGARMCEIIFSGKLPSPAMVDKIVRESLEKAIQKDPSKDILAAASLGDEDLNSNQYSGRLVYKAAEKKILTFDEYYGVKTSTSSTSSYFVEVKEDHTYAGVTPAKKWLILTIVFPKTPSREIAYDKILAEIQKVTNRGLDVNAYVSIGDKNVKSSWNQMRDNDGAYVFAEYESATKKVTRKGELLKEL